MCEERVFVAVKMRGTHTHISQVMSELGRLSTIVEEVIATSQGTSFYVQTKSGEGAGPGTFLTQDEGESGLGSGFLVDLVPRLSASSDSEMLKVKVWTLMKAYITKFPIVTLVKYKQKTCICTECTCLYKTMFFLQRVRRRLWCMQLRT